MEGYKAPTLQLVLAWAVMTAIGVAMALGIGILPSPGSSEALIVDHTIAIMTALAVPIFSLVVVVLVYSAFRFKANGKPSDFGAPIEGNQTITVVWVAVSTVLVLYLAWFGSVGLLDIRAHAEGAAAGKDNALQIDVIGTRFAWELRYTKEKVVSRDELVLQVGRPVYFRISAVDVLHSFWIPAFRTKIDAVPGVPTFVSATPDRVGNFETDENYRVQCAELCGAGHAIMSVPVRVVEAKDFDAWVTKKAAAGVK